MLKRACTIAVALLVLAVGCSKSEPEKEAQAPAVSGPTEKMYFLYIKIPEEILPLDRGKKYEDPIHDLLARHKLGEVTGGGTMLKEGGSIEYVGVDVDTTDPEKAIPLLVSKLKEIGAPPGTVIEQNEPVKRMVEVK